MTDLLDLLSIEDGGTGNADHTPVVHIVTPDFATLCREDFLAMRARGDRCSVNPHRDRRDFEVIDEHGRGRYKRTRWRNVTCPWCRSLGVAYYRHLVTVMGHWGAAA